MRLSLEDYLKLPPPREPEPLLTDDHPVSWRAYATTLGIGILLAGLLALMVWLTHPLLLSIYYQHSLLHLALLECTEIATILTFAWAFLRVAVSRRLPVAPHDNQKLTTSVSVTVGASIVLTIIDLCASVHLRTDSDHAFARRTRGDCEITGARKLNRDRFGQEHALVKCRLCDQQGVWRDSYRLADGRCPENVFAAINRGAFPVRCSVQYDPEVPTRFWFQTENTFLDHPEGTFIQLMGPFSIFATIFGVVYYGSRQSLTHYPLEYFWMASLVASLMLAAIFMMP
jgi:hypothetical protein